MDNYSIEIQEIWAPCAAGEGEAVRFEDGQNLKLVARIANGHPIYLAKDVALERIHTTPEEFERQFPKSAKTVSSPTLSPGT